MNVKKLISKLPSTVQHSLRCQKYGWQIKRGKFASSEMEYGLLDDLLKEGDWVLDVGANVGHYTKRFSELVGARGRVIAVEPSHETFSILVANSRYFAYPNVTLLNIAASDSWRPVSMTVPKGQTGLDGHYLAHIADHGEVSTVAGRLDALALSQRIKLIKLDVESHEVEALNGLTGIIDRDQPILIIEAGADGIEDFLSRWNYIPQHLPGSHNLVFMPKEVAIH